MSIHRLLEKQIQSLESELAECKKQEQIATKALIYLAGKLSTKEKLSPNWIQEALKEATDE